MNKKYLHYLSYDRRQSYTTGFTHNHSLPLIADNYFDIEKAKEWNSRDDEGYDYSSLYLIDDIWVFKRDWNAIAVQVSSIEIIPIIIQYGIKLEIDKAEELIRESYATRYNS